MTQRAFERVNKFLETPTLEELRAALKYTAERSGAVPWLPHPSFIEMFDRAIRLVPPPWYAGGFAVEGREADFSYWARMSSWSWDEATALSMGFEPCGPIEGRTGEPPANPNVLEFYRKRRQLVGNRFFEVSSEGTMPKPTPLEFAKWAAEFQLDVPDDLHRAVMQITGQSYPIPAWKAASPVPAKELEGRERESLLRLTIGMAIKGYSYDPSAQRSDIPNLIRSDLHLLGLDLHPETIRLYLREAALLLSDKVKTEQHRSRRKKRVRKAE